MGTSRTALRFVGGLLLWSAAEYAVHRWIMHGRAAGTGRAVGLLTGPVVSEHLDHHRTSGSTVRLRVDPHNVGYKSLTFVVVSSIAGLAVGAGFTVGYGAYTGLHDRIHHRRPNGSLATLVWHHHLEHHRLGRDGIGANFDVTSALWDRAAGTQVGDVTAPRPTVGRMQSR